MHGLCKHEDDTGDPIVIELWQKVVGKQSGGEDTQMALVQGVSNMSNFLKSAAKVELMQLSRRC